MFFSTYSLTAKALIGGVVLTFIIIGIVLWPQFKQALPNYQTPELTDTFVPERTPQEIITAYQTNLNSVATVINSSEVVVNNAHSALENFFFSARVPEAARNAHLKAALEFQNTDSKKTDLEKINQWQKIITQLQTATAGL